MTPWQRELDGLLAVLGEALVYAGTPHEVWDDSSEDQQMKWTLTAWEAMTCKLIQLQIRAEVCQREARVESVFSGWPGRRRERREFLLVCGRVGRIAESALVGVRAKDDARVRLEIRSAISALDALGTHLEDAYLAAASSGSLEELRSLEAI